MNAGKKREEGPVQMQTVSPAKVSGYIMAWTVDWGSVIDLFGKIEILAVLALWATREKAAELIPNHYLRGGLQNRQAGGGLRDPEQRCYCLQWLSCGPSFVV